MGKKIKVAIVGVGNCAMLWFRASIITKEIKVKGSVV